MINIFRIFITDVKRIFTNVVALVVMMGLTVIPCLYAWFNIFSNWDPYGPAATGNLPVAVYSSDKGTNIDDFSINVGNTIIDNLKANNSINWQFTDSSADAIEGVKRGTYYACLIINEDFSDDLISFLGGNPVHPHITYYENEKKNAIAPKITATVKTTVQSEVNSAFVGTLADAVFRASSFSLSSEKGKGFYASIVDRVYTLDSDLSTMISVIDSYISMLQTAQSLMKAVEAVDLEMDQILNAGSEAIDAAQSATEAATATVEVTGDIVTGTLRSSANDLRALMSKTDKIGSSVNTVAKTSYVSLEALYLAVSAAKTGVTQSITFAEAYLGYDYSKELSDINTDFDKLLFDITYAQASSEKTGNDVQKIFSTISQDLSVTADNVDKLADTYDTSVDPKLKDMLSSLRSSLDSAEDLLNTTGSSIDSVSAVLSAYPDLMGVGTDSLSATRDELVEMKEKLGVLIGKLNSAVENEDYQAFLSILQRDPDLISDFISSPVDVEETPIYEIKNNGSAMAPFYIVLSIWVGSLILIAIVHTKVIDPIGVTKEKNYQNYFGRYLIFFFVGQFQTILTVLGAIFFVGIQVQHPFLFFIAASFSSFAYTLLNYSLAYAFGAVGEAVSIVLMVVQVAGSGGSFPVEVLPKTFQVLYKYMPFAHSMNAIRETVAGMHEKDYFIYLSGLIWWILASLIIGLFLSIPAKRLNEKIEHSKERTDIMV